MRSRIEKCNRHVVHAYALVFDGYHTSAGTVRVLTAPDKAPDGSGAP